MITQFGKFNDAESHMSLSSLGENGINVLMRIIYLYSQIALFSHEFVTLARLVVRTKYYGRALF